MTRPAYAAISFEHICYLPEAAYDKNIELFEREIIPALQ
jgi:hypothetical protein